MEKTGVVKLAGVLKVLVTVTFLCNLLILPLVPGIVGTSALVYYPRVSPLEFFAACWQYLWRVWRVEYFAVLTVFLLFCGVCTAVILWQGRRVLDSIIRECTFTLDNARSLRRASVCCFLIAAAALARMLWSFGYYRSLVSVFSYNALFIPLFLMGGLLCMVMSALFRQAAELKEENDLTI